MMESYIAEHGTGEDDDGQRRRKGDVAERQIRVAGFDSHCDEVEAPVLELFM